MIGRRRTSGNISQSGFTLLEIVVVFVVLGIASTIAMPMFDRWLDRDKRTSAAGALVRRLRQCRDRAIRYGNPGVVDVANRGSRPVDFEMSTVVRKADVTNPEIPSRSPITQYRCMPTGAIYGPHAYSLLESSGQIRIVDPLLGRIQTSP
jgi:prepilin-type N-terminal cleavage/methylation domain-containing protein